MSGPAAAVLIEARDLTLAVHGRALVHALNWRAESGQRWCVIGRNAAGKSTLLRALAGLPVAQRSGEVLWHGRRQSAWPAGDAAALRAFMPQQPSDRFGIRVRRLLELSVVVPGQREILATLDALDAGALIDRNVLELSGGERQRIALAQCALQGAALMLLDEPVAFQDPAHEAQVGNWLASLDAACLVISAHDVNWIARVATHVLALHDDGHCRQGTVGQLLDAPTLRNVYGCDWRSEGGFWIAQ